MSTPTTSKSPKYRLAIVSSHPIQYMVPLYRALSKHPNIELEVFYPESHRGRGEIDSQFGIPVNWNLSLTEGYTHHFLATHRIFPYFPKHIFEFWCPELPARLTKQSFDAIYVAGHSTVLEWLTIGTALRNSIPLIVRPEAHLNSYPRGVFKTWLRDLILNFLYKRISGYLAIGKESEQHFLKHGGIKGKIYSSPYSVDNHFFQTAVERLPSKKQLRTELKIPENSIVLLFCAKLISKKEPFLLAEALNVCKASDRFSLLVVGDGELSTEFENKISKTKLRSFHFVGFKNQTDIPYYYKASDLLVLPSSLESWGLVVNEAMNASVPVLASSVVGCAADLIEEGVTGFIFRNRDALDLATKLNFIAENKLLLEGMGAAALDKINQYSLDASVSGFVNALHSLRKI